MVDKYGVKLLTSGYGRDQTMRILMGGAKGYLAKVKRRKKDGGRVHRTAQESSSGRIRKKLLGKSSWYKDMKKSEEEPTKGSGTWRRKGDAVEDRSLRTRAVLFVEHTPKGELARRVREQLQHMGASLGFKIRVVERTGRNILTNFPQTITWKCMVCGRQECVTCHQGGKDRPDCTRVNLVQPWSPEQG